MAYEHSSGLAGAYDRTPSFPDWTDVVFREGKFAQGAELNEVSALMASRGRRVGDLVAKDGDRVSGADIIVNAGAATVTLSAGQVYAKGDVRNVNSHVFSDVAMTGEVVIGVRIVQTVVTEVENPALYGLHPGTEGEGEPGAARVVETVAWGIQGDGVVGDLYPVYTLKDGVAIDQTAPPSLTGFNQAIAIYDREAHGSYVVRGCRVVALGKIASAWHFAISEGVANIRGFKRTRETALRHVEPETFDVQRINSEPHTFADGGSGTVTLSFNRWPLDTLVTAVITKERTVTLTKGTTNSIDPLPDAAVTSIISVVQGGTTYTPTTDYVRTGDSVDWTPAGIEPASGSSYDVTYQYLIAVTPDSSTAKTVTLSDGVTDSSVFLTYNWKLPRVDLLCLDDTGRSVYIKGVSAQSNPRAPIAPSTLLALARVRNDWLNTPVVENTDVRSVPYEELWVYLRRLWTLIDLVALERLKSNVDNREPVAKKGVFVDPLTNDVYRDAGELPQSAAVFDGTMQLAIDPTFYVPVITEPLLLDYTDEVIIRQDLSTRCHLINPYQNFDALPGEMQLSPSSDFWSVQQTEWLSPVTREFQGTGRTETDEQMVSERTDLIEFLRQIEIDFVIRGFGNGELLDELTFDGIDVNPGGLVADASGVVTGSFLIPANVTAGTKQVVATGAGGTFAQAQFVGQGTIDVNVMRRVTTIWRAPLGNTGGRDPLAQTFRVVEGRHMPGVNIVFCAKGDPANACILQMRGVENGFPTSEIIAESFIDMNTVVLGAQTEVRFRMPPYIDPAIEVAYVLLTDDPVHAISIAGLGDFDTVQQIRVAAQPYSVGVMLSSSNASTWTGHQNEDWTFQGIGAKFGPFTKTVELGSFAVTNMSDILVRAAVELPTADCSVVFEIERADASKIYVLPNQNWELSEFVTETVILRAVLMGTEKVSPILYPGVLFIAGSLRTTGTYVSRAFNMGAAIRMSTFLKSLLPAGSSYTVEVDGADDIWSAVSVFATEVLDEGWTEKEHRIDPYTADTGRLRITLNGSPAARPRLSDLRAVSI